MVAASLSLGADDEDFPRRFAQLPFGSKTHILAYGGDDGSISLIEGNASKTARRFSERVRAIASSQDGTRVAVGFGDGSTTVFVYKSLDGDVHPFLAALHKSGEDADELFSQIDGMEEDNADEDSFPGPRFQTPVRALAFDPRKSNMLACGSEDSGFCIVDATSSASLSKKRFLAVESASEHNETGVRGLAYFVNGDQALLASLDLQGRLCVWDVTGDDPELDYELIHKDGHRCVAKVDLGDINDSEPADQSCFPVFGKSSLLGLPGSNDLQLRSVTDVEKQRFVPSIDGKGHIESIVSLAFSEDEKYAVTGGRDCRIVLWKTEGDVS
jgi:WD40 repeat protein